MRHTFRTILAASLCTLALVACDQQSVFDLGVGDCFDDTSGIDGGEISSVPIVDCAEPHDNEVYFSYEYVADSFPGDSAIQAEALQRCIDEFEGYVGIDYMSSSLDVFPITPTQESWDEADDRGVLCALYDLELAKLTGSMEGAEV